MLGILNASNVVHLIAADLLGHIFNPDYGHNAPRPSESIWIDTADDKIEQNQD